MVGVVKKLFILVMLGIILVGCTGGTSTDEAIIKIGITQIIEHPALDAAREGFIKALEEGGYKVGENIEFEFQSAQGEFSTAQTIAERFVSQKKDLILAIATHSAQTAFNATKDIPILITAVTDPLVAGIVKGWDVTETNVTGTSDSTPIDKQFALIKEMLPKSKKIGILFNTSEVNSQVQVDKAISLASQFGFEIITSPVTSVNDVHQSLNHLLNNVDLIYAITDNVVASSIELITNNATERGIPVIGAEKAMVESGALATEGIDYFALGFETGLMAIEVLNGRDPKEMGISTLKNTELVINMEVANKLNIAIPEAVKQRAIIIGEK